jgi:hypothetical protein
MSSRAYFAGLYIQVPLRTSPGGNNREHWRARHRRVKKEREAVAWALVEHKQRPVLPAVVHLERRAPSNGLDDDNLRMSLKAIRDQVAVWLGVDDRDPRVRWEYHQMRDASWAVGILVEAKDEVVTVPLDALGVPA